MRPRTTTVAERPHPPRLRKAPGAAVEDQDSEADGPPPRKRRWSRTLVFSIVAHVVVLLGASYWVVARHTAPSQPAGMPDGDPFPLMHRGEPESSSNSPATYHNTPPSPRTLPEPDLPRLVMKELLTQAAALPLEMPAPMFVEKNPLEPILIKDSDSASKPTEQIAIRAKKTSGGGAMKKGKAKRKATTAGSSTPEISGHSGGSSFALGQLDGKPRLLYHPPAVFPVELIHQGATTGTVVLEVELDESGAVHVMGMVSTTHPDLVAEAKRVAAGSSFTPPLHEGRHVKAHMTWPIIIHR